MNFLSRHQIITDVGNKITITEALPKPFVDRISTSGTILSESFDVKFSRLKRLFENDRCVVLIYLTAEDGLKVVYKNVQSNVYLSDDRVEISQNYFIKQCCTLVSSKYHYPIKSVADNALMTLKAKKFSSTHKNVLPVLFLIKPQDDAVSTDVLKVFAYYSEIYLKSLLPSTTAVFVDVSIDKLYYRLINFIFMPTGKLKPLFFNYEEENGNTAEYFGCVDSDIRINKRTFEIRFDSLLPYDDAVNDDRMSKFAKVFLQWYTEDRSEISFSKEHIKDFIAKGSVVETFYPIEKTYVFEKFYREYKRLNEDIGGENDESEDFTITPAADSIDPFCILSENVESLENVENAETVENQEFENVFRVDDDVYVYDFKNFTACIFLHFFPDEPILSETLRLLSVLKESGALGVATAAKGFLVKLFGYSKHIGNCPLYHFCNNFGIYFMCRLADLFLGKTLLCCRDSVFLCEAIDFGIFEDDDFYVKNLVLENRFDRFFYSDCKHYVGYCDAPEKRVVLKGFCRKNVPRFQMDLLEGLFLEYFEGRNVDESFDFWSSFNGILQSFGFDDIYRLTFSYSGVTNARYFYYNRLEDDFFVFSDEIEHRSLDKGDDLVKPVGFRTIGRCYNLSFNEYLKCVMCGIVKDKLVSAVLKVDESVLEPFRRYCGVFMNTCGGSFMTPNVMGSFVYSSEYLWSKYGGEGV